MYDFFDHVYNKRVLSNYEVIIHHLAVSMLKLDSLTLCKH